ncbi:MAG: ABC transporter permease, partial [Solirubrobacteraceae bacterium]
MSLRRGGRGLAIGVVDLAVVLIVASLLTYSLVLLAPGDAATGVAVHRAGPGATAEQIEQVREELGLDEGAGPAQYVRWLGDAIQGDLGTSARTGQPVGAELLERLPV